MKDESVGKTVRPKLYYFTNTAFPGALKQAPAIGQPIARFGHFVTVADELPVVMGVPLKVQRCFPRSQSRRTRALISIHRPTGVSRLVIRADCITGVGRKAVARLFPLQPLFAQGVNGPTRNL